MAHQDNTLDVRGLPAPEPLEHCLEALAELKPVQQLNMLIDREPFPLYSILDRNGYQHKCEFIDPNFIVTIWFE